MALFVGIHTVLGNLHYLGNNTYLVTLGVVFNPPFNISDLKVCGL